MKALLILLGVAAAILGANIITKAPNGGWALAGLAIGLGGVYAIYRSTKVKG